MAFAKKVVIAVGMEDTKFEGLKPLRSMEFLKHSDVYFVHVFNTITYAFGFGELPLVYPIEEDRKLIEESIHGVLVNAAHEALPKDFQGRCHHKCLFSDSPKSKFSDYVNELKADLIIIPTRKKHGLFESSFAQYVNKHTSASAILLKKHKE